MKTKYEDRTLIFSLKEKTQKAAWILKIAALVHFGSI